MFALFPRACSSMKTSLRICGLSFCAAGKGVNTVEKTAAGLDSSEIGLSTFGGFSACAFLSETDFGAGVVDSLIDRARRPSWGVKVGSLLGGSGSTNGLNC